MCDKNFNTTIVGLALEIWIHDPVDRITTANAGLNNNILISKDQNILDHYTNGK